MTRKLEIDEKVLDTVEFVAIVFLATVAIACFFAFFAFVINGGCAG